MLATLMSTSLYANANLHLLIICVKIFSRPRIKEPHGQSQEDPGTPTGAKPRVAPQAAQGGRRGARPARRGRNDVYRRFRDKDELLETAILGILERQEERLKAGMTVEMAAKIPLDVFADQIIGGMVVTYRTHAALLRALRQFTQGRANASFLRKASKLEVRSYERLVDLVLAGRKDIRHPNPRIAVSLGFMMVISTLYELVVMPVISTRDWKGLLPKDDQALKRELTRAFLSYLDLEPKPGSRRP
jgi:AcrR family transcriptional regulator